MYKKALIAALISCMTVSAAGCQMNSTKTDTIPDSTADINAAPTAEPAEGESWAEPVVLVKGESTRLIDDHIPQFEPYCHGGTVVQFLNDTTIFSAQIL